LQTNKTAGLSLDCEVGIWRQLAAAVSGFGFPVSSQVLLTGNGKLETENLQSDSKLPHSTLSSFSLATQ